MKLTADGLEQGEYFRVKRLEVVKAYLVFKEVNLVYKLHDHEGDLTVYHKMGINKEIKDYIKSIWGFLNEQNVVYVEVEDE